MTVTKLFRFELTIKVDINVEKIKDTDYGRIRYVKQLLNHLLKDPEAVRAFIIIHFLARYIHDGEDEIRKLVDTGENENFYILRAAKKCPTEAQSFFNDIIAPGEVKKKGKKRVRGPDFGSTEAIENDWLFDYLQSKLEKIVTVKADFSELPGVILNHVHNPVKIKKRKMKKIGTVTHDMELSSGEPSVTSVAKAGESDLPVKFG